NRLQFGARARLDLDGLPDVADLQVDIAQRGFADHHSEFQRRLAEAGGGYSEPVISGRQVRKVVLPGLVRLRLQDKVGRQAPQLDLGVRDGSPVLIVDCADQRSCARRLRVRLPKQAK